MVYGSSTSTIIDATYHNTGLTFNPSTKVLTIGNTQIYSATSTTNTTIKNTDDEDFYFEGGSLFVNDTMVSLDGHTHSYLPLSGGTLTGTLNSRSIIPTSNGTYNIGDGGNAYNNIHTAYIYGNKGGSLSFGNITSSGSWKTGQLVISNNGSVGIGGTNTNYKLFVTGGNIYFSNELHINDWICMHGQTIYFGSDGNTPYIYGDDSSSSDAYIYLGSYPGDMLYMNYYEANFSGDVYCDELYNSSDIRLKDIVDYNALVDVNTIASAPAIRFTWKDPKKNKGLNCGSIAQYWDDVMPECINHNSKDGYLSMQYDVIALLAAISIAKKVVNHEERIAELEKENEALRAEINQIKAA